MKASVVVIDYKRKKYILDALQSIKNQKGINLNSRTRGLRPYISNLRPPCATALPRSFQT